MKFNDLKLEYNLAKQEFDVACQNVLSSGWYLLGPNLELFENKMAIEANQKYAVGVKNATDAISLTLKEVYRPKMPVIIPNFGAYPTAVATHNVVNKEDIYYVDVDRTTTMDNKKMPNLKNGIVIFVALFGNAGNIKYIKDYCIKNNHILILDSAQAFGTHIEHYADYTIYSFYPTKPLNAFGDGGMIVSNKPLSRLIARRFYGMINGRVEYKGGVNSRLDELQSAMLKIKLKLFPKLLEMRKKVCKEYLSLQLPSFIKWVGNPVYHQFVLLCKDREKFINKLKENKIPYMIHYPYHITNFIPLRANNNKVGYKIDDKIISIPCHPFLDNKDINLIKNVLISEKDNFMEN
jgi:dTDP-4-amino-4,6-dideoxygalactose transaminase